MADYDMNAIDSLQDHTYGSSRISASSANMGSMSIAGLQLNASVSMPMDVAFDACEMIGLGTDQGGGGGPSPGAYSGRTVPKLRRSIP